MKYGILSFKKINFEKHSEVAIKFRAEAALISFGTDKDFWGEDGLVGQRYIEGLKVLDSKKSDIFHIWMNGEIIGQMELGLFKDDETWGYVSLYYLKDQFRGKGYSKYLDSFAVDFLKSLGVNKAKLSVSPNNKRAVQFYKKHEWKNKGLRRFKKNVFPYPLHIMEKVF